MKKHFGIYSYFYLFLISVLSIFCIDKQNYLTEIFPIMCYLGFIIFLTTNLIYSKKLRFCKFKKLSTISLILYFTSCICAVMFKLNIYIYFSYFFISMSFLFLLFLLWKK